MRHVMCTSCRTDKRVISVVRARKQTSTIRLLQCGSTQYILNIQIAINVRVNQKPRTFVIQTHIARK